MRESLIEYSIRGSLESLNLSLGKSKHFSKFECNEDTVVIRHYPVSRQDPSAFEYGKREIIGHSHHDVVEYLP